MMKKVIAAALALCMAAGMASCAKGNEGTGNAIKIGGIGPTTGSNAVYGTAVKNGADIAIKEINAKGGLQFEMSFQDDESNGEKAVNAYNKLKDWGMQVLMGTVTSDPCTAVVSESANDNMFQLTPSASAVEAIQHPNAFRVCFSDPDQGFGAAKYIGENDLAKKVGIIYDSSDVYSSGIYKSFSKEAANHSFEIVASEAFTADSNTDFTVQLQKIQNAGADLIFLPIYYKEASLILTQANKMGFTPAFFGCDGLDGLLAVENFDVALAENVMLLTPFAADAQDDLTKNFVAAYKEAYNETPNQFAADAYDAIYAIAEACEKGGVTVDMPATDICDKLMVQFTQITINGLTGDNMSWTEEGEPNKAPRAVIIKNGVYTAM